MFHVGSHVAEFEAGFLNRHYEERVEALQAVGLAG